jgi:hypothetical protein
VGHDQEDSDTEEPGMRSLQGLNIGGADAGPVWQGEQDDICPQPDCTRPRHHTGNHRNAALQEWKENDMSHGGLGTLAPSQRPSPGNWVERGAIADGTVRRVWLRAFDNIPISVAGLATTTLKKGSTDPNYAAGGVAVAAVQFTRSSDSLVMTVDADDIIAVSAT